jgi:anti-sigma regulatory factor (Ser/Thr protein kinase)
MNTMAPTRPADLQSRRVRLVTGPAAVPEARSQVRAAIRSWKVPVDPETAVLLTSELVTNAVRHETGPSVVLIITRSCGELRVDVHDTSRCLPEVVDIPADAETGRGLLLVGALSSEWGFYRTPAGKAVYFTLTCPARPSPRGRRTPPATDAHSGTVNRDPSRGSPSTAQRSCDPRGTGT